MPTANEIRQQFIDFFCKKHGHTFVPSSPVVPHDDPTLLFANAGMNQFKPYFLGTEKPPYKRVANTQKCIRAGGKHNDLDDVGKDTYHHTFFEMLGNWSFGDYFKKEAIAWAWELLTDVWKLDKTRLHVTVFEGDVQNGIPRDDEAKGHWQAVGVADNHIHYGSRKDNFWEMGETGPCGPCTEINYDSTPDKSGGQLVNKGSPDVIEIWNLVFIQFNRNPDQSLTPLPAKHVDTGMGLERVVKVLQGKASNYDTDMFTPIFAAIEKVTGAPPYSGKLDDLKDTAYRVIADHIRTLTFAITDGAEPSNTKRGFVLRSILRRAERYGWQHLGTTKPFVCDLVATVVEVMGGAFPELKRNPQRVIDVIREEEKSFLATLDRGLKLFNDAANLVRKAGGDTLAGEDAFKLHDTYGVFIDITEQMAAESGLKVDREGYQELMDQAKRKAREAQKKHIVTAVSGEVPKTSDEAKYEGGELTAKVLGWVSGNEVVRSGKLSGEDSAALLVDRTNFYAEAGGQVGDVGIITTPTGRFSVDDTQRLGDTILHFGQVAEGTIEVGQSAILRVDGIRLDVMRNHTSTHLMNLALRDVLGGHVEQKGSLVDADKTRFDFTHAHSLSHDEIARIERHVNERIHSDLPVTAVVLPLAEAKKLPGVRAVFGEKYPDPVRVVMIGADRPEQVTRELSTEFCGGTHLGRSSQAGLFKIVSQEPVAKGVRRVTAVTGKRAVESMQRLSSVVDDLTGQLNCKADELPGRVAALQEELKKLQQQLKKGAAGDLAGAADKALAAADDVGGAKLIVGEMPAAPADALRAQIDRMRQKAGSSVIALGWADDGKVGLLVAVTDDLAKKGLHAGKLVGEAAKIADGKGGGNPTLAQAGGKNPAKLGEALARAKELAQQLLSKT
ncbi:MAG TPA: alanine--tRNA ligase [Gemmataceae bacterium]|jgi:alanyl-tRNA synthetase|nr:alanine--tRNA ligase [Gemmataceae bacterium]